ncbi:MAG TPA: hypothetical protein VFC07_01300 [Verrucomicrobiae bacterium]|nr:hypothetical protein [Verrucomicrobiae bacterium]
MPSVFDVINATKQHRYQPVRQMIMTKPAKRSKFGFHRHFTVIAAAYLSVLILGRADTAYLPAVGPSPLRFRPDFKPVAHIVYSPPPTVSQPDVPLPAQKVEKVSVPVPPTPPPEPIPAIDKTNGIVEPPRPEGVVSPQMLLKYFNRPTKGNSAGVSAPIDFTPPPSAEPPSSKATYSTPPH